MLVRAQHRAVPATTASATAPWPAAPVDYDTDVGDADPYPAVAPASLSPLGGEQGSTVRWKLSVYDDTLGAAGFLPRWFLTVHYGQPAAPSPSTLVVSAMPHAVSDVDLVLHDVDAIPRDMELVLESPDGRYAHVLSDAADADPVIAVDLTLDDEAEADIPRCRHARVWELPAHATMTMTGPVRARRRPRHRRPWTRSCRPSTASGQRQLEAVGVPGVLLRERHDRQLVAADPARPPPPPTPLARPPPPTLAADTTAPVLSDVRLHAEPSAHRRRARLLALSTEAGEARRPRAAQARQRVEARRHQALVDAGRGQHAVVLRQDRAGSLEVGHVPRAARGDRRGRQRLRRGPACGSRSTRPSELAGDLGPSAVGHLTRSVRAIGQKPRALVRSTDMQHRSRAFVSIAAASLVASALVAASPPASAAAARSRSPRRSPSRTRIPTFVEATSTAVVPLNDTFVAVSTLEVERSDGGHADLRRRHSSISPTRGWTISTSSWSPRAVRR